jgi:SAM-dependent methyltransferase
MLRYLGAAITLRALSLYPGPLVYRLVANQLGGRLRARSGVPRWYIDRANLLISIVERNGMAGCGGRVFELGTGWVHWYGAVAALVTGGHADLFDVVDNRQLTASKKYLATLDQLAFPQTVRPNVKAVAQEARHADSFEDLYSAIGMDYSVDRRGSLAGLSSNAYQVAISFHVLEHVHRESIDNTIGEFKRILKPGGLSIHQIGIDDHLAHYDRRAHPKQYLSITPSVWRRLFENRLQYFNRLQLPEWEDRFERHGFVLVEAFAERCSLGNLRVVDEYCHLSDLDATIVTLIHRKAG